MKYHTDEKTRRKYKQAARERKRTEAEQKEKNQSMIDRIKYLFDHSVHKFPIDSKERKELNQTILEVLNRPKPISWRPILPRNAEPVDIFDLFDFLGKKN